MYVDGNVTADESPAVNESFATVEDSNAMDGSLLTTEPQEKDKPIENIEESSGDDEVTEVSDPFTNKEGASSLTKWFKH